jgi:acyl carrier protein
MELEQARQLMAEAFRVRAEQIPDDARLGHQLGWDSLSHLRLILAIEERVGRVLAPEEVVSVRALKDVARLV